jgi:hypothetical protein
MSTEVTEILDNPVTNNEPVTGVCEGRIVAYWPTKEQASDGLRAVGGGRYIPAMITASWAGRGEVASPMPCANLQLFPDRMNVSTHNMATAPGVSPEGAMGSVRFSLEPAYGCWTWIPKA